MKRAPLLLLPALLAPGALSAQTAKEHLDYATAAPDRIAARLDALVPGLMTRHHVPGVSIAGIRDCRVAWERHYGVKRAGGKEKVDGRTLFEACSMTKPVFAYAFMKLVETKKMELDRPLVDYLGRPYLEGQPLHRRITARMVLSHTTGLPNWRQGGWRKGGPMPVRFEPGSRFGYSGEGFLFLQRAVEKVTGEPLDRFMRKRLLDPLGMKLSSYKWEKRCGKLAAAGHDREGRPKEPRRAFRRPNGAYSLYCTPREYALFLVEVMAEDRSRPWSLRASTLAAMLEPAVTAKGRKPVSRGGKRSEKPVTWGLGWPLDESARGPRVYHGGTNGTGFRCYSEFDPKGGYGIVIMTNGLGGNRLWARVIDEIAPP